LHNPERFYQWRSSQLKRAAARLTRIDRFLVILKMITALSLPAVFLNAAWRTPLTMVLSLGLLIIAFLLHEPLLGKIKRINAVLRLTEQELLYLKGARLPSPPGWMRSSGDHPYDFDLNISGENGLFVFLSRCRTRVGKKILHQWLLHPAPVCERILRQKALSEFRDEIRFRERFLSAMNEDDEPKFPDRPPDVSLIPTTPVLPVLILCLPLLNIPALIMGVCKGSWWHLILLFFIQVIVNFTTGLRQKEIIGLCRGVGSEMGKTSALLSLMEGHRFKSEMLKAGLGRITAGHVPASRAISRLHRLLQCLELRGSSIHPLINNLVLWDILFITLLSRWRRIYGEHLGEWLNVCGEWEALCSLGTILFNHPNWTFPEFVDDPLFVEIDNLGHPLLESRNQVRNDCHIPGPHHLFFITGPNMAGKSTYIRAVATAMVMAQAGAPVSASRIRLGRMSILTSLSHTDSLSEGKSLFHKELDRLSLVWERCHQPGEPVLFFLDEMLRGTNPLDRHNGSCWVLRLLARQDASGLVATHDLGLTTLEDGENVRLSVQNRHFSCRITSKECLFDYRLLPGSAPSVNALPLMRQRGFPIPLETGEAD